MQSANALVSFPFSSQQEVLQGHEHFLVGEILSKQMDILTKALSRSVTP